MTKKVFLPVLRVLLTAGFIALVFTIIDIDEFMAVFREMNIGLAVGMGCLGVVPITVLAVRWWLILRAAGIPVAFTRIASLTFAASFFNTFLPGGVGGDIAKAVMSTRGEERKATIVGTILLDRVLGLCSMVLMAASVSLTQFGNPALTQPIIVVWSMFGGMILLAGLYYSPLFRRPWLKERLPFRAVLHELDHVAQTVRTHKGMVLLAVVLSFAAQSMTILLIYGFARAMGIDNVPLSQFFLIQPILFVIVAVPISLGGWGVGEYAFSWFYGLVGVPSAKGVALSIVSKAGVMIASTPGAILFALGLTGKKDETPDPERP